MTNKFDRLISLKDACDSYNKGESTLREAIARGKFKEGIDVKKFGKQWVFDMDALDREYKKEKKMSYRKKKMYKLSDEVLPPNMILSEDYNDYDLGDWEGCKYFLYIVPYMRIFRAFKNIDDTVEYLEYIKENGIAIK